MKALECHQHHRRGSLREGYGDLQSRGSPPSEHTAPRDRLYANVPSCIIKPFHSFIRFTSLHPLFPKGLTIRLVLSNFKYKSTASAKTQTSKSSPFCFTSSLDFFLLFIICLCSLNPYTSAFTSPVSCVVACAAMSHCSWCPPSSANRFARPGIQTTMYAMGNSDSSSQCLVS